MLNKYLSDVEKAELILKGTHCHSCFEPFDDSYLYGKHPNALTLCVHCVLFAGPDGDEVTDADWNE